MGFDDEQGPRRLRGGEPHELLALVGQDEGGGNPGPGGILGQGRLQEAGEAGLVDQGPPFVEGQGLAPLDQPRGDGERHAAIDAHQGPGMFVGLCEPAGVAHHHDRAAQEML